MCGYVWVCVCEYVSMCVMMCMCGYVWVCAGEHREHVYVSVSSVCGYVCTSMSMCVGMCV